MKAYRFQADDAEPIIYKVSLQVYIPKIIEKFYNEGGSSLSELERCVLIMSLSDKDKARELAGDDKIMNEYIEESEYVKDENFFLRRKMDKEEDIKEYAFEIGIEKGIEQGLERGLEQGIEQGIEQGRIENTIEIVKKMIKKGLSPNEIQEIANISMSEIEELINS